MPLTVKATASGGEQEQETLTLLIFWPGVRDQTCGAPGVWYSNNWAVSDLPAF